MSQVLPSSSLFETLSLYFHAHNPKKATPKNISLICEHYQDRNQDLGNGLYSKYGESLHDFCKFFNTVKSFLCKHNPVKASHLNLLRIMQTYGSTKRRAALYKALEAKYGASPCEEDALEVVDENTPSDVTSAPTFLHSDSCTAQYFAEFRANYMSLDTASLCSTSAPSSNCSSPCSTTSWIRQWDPEHPDDVSGDTKQTVDLSSLIYSPTAAGLTPSRSLSPTSTNSASLSEEDGLDLHIDLSMLDGTLHTKAETHFETDAETEIDTESQTTCLGFA